MFYNNMTTEFTHELKNQHVPSNFPLEHCEESHENCTRWFSNRVFFRWSWRFQESQKIGCSCEYFHIVDILTVNQCPNSESVSHYLLLWHNFRGYSARLCPWEICFLVLGTLGFFNFPKLEILYCLIKIFKFDCCSRWVQLSLSPLDILLKFALENWFFRYWIIIWSRQNDECLTTE